MWTVKRDHQCSIINMGTVFVGEFITVMTGPLQFVELLIAI
jgi:hypothetical protein